MADRGHADADQVVGRQRQQHFAIDIIVAECRRVLFEPQPAQPRHCVHAVTLDSEERQPLMEEDIPLVFGVPAAALKHAPCRVSRLQVVSDCFSMLRHHIPGKPGMSRFHRGPVKRRSSPIIGQFTVIARAKR
jgi:hypothetical protein